MAALTTAAGVSRLAQLEGYLRAANYLAAAQIYLRDNVLLERPLRPEHIKTRPLAGWRTQPGLNLIYAHLNRLINDTAAKVLLVVGPGDGGPAILANLFLEGALSEIDAGLRRNREGVRQLVLGLSRREWADNRIGPSTPGAIDDGCELGYSLFHGLGAAIANPDTIVACIIGEREAQTGQIAASWHSHKYLDPATDGALLPIVVLSGSEHARSSFFARMSGLQLHQYFYGCGYEAREVAAVSAGGIHAKLWAALDWAYRRICDIQRAAREQSKTLAPWPLIALRTDNANQPPYGNPGGDPDQPAALELWLRGYAPQQVLDPNDFVAEAILETIPPANLRMGASRLANAGGTSLAMQPAPGFGVERTVRGTVAEGTRVLDDYLRDLARAHPDARIFRICSQLPLNGAESPKRDDGAIEVHSTYACVGLLEGYTLTGRHGVCITHDALSVMESMVSQHQRWLKNAATTVWREPLPSLNVVITGAVDSLIGAHSSTTNIYLPPDVNSLLWIVGRCLQSRNRINLIVSANSPLPQWLDRDEAAAHCLAGASEWPWASSGEEPEVVLAAAGDLVTQEALAAISLLRCHAPKLKTRFVNVVDLFTLASRVDHERGLPDRVFEQLFTPAKPVVFAFYGHPRVVHELVRRRPVPQRFHVRGFAGGDGATPFDSVVRNGVSRYHLAIEAIRRAGLGDAESDHVIRHFIAAIETHHLYLLSNGADSPEVLNWRWSEGAKSHG